MKERIMRFLTGHAGAVLGIDIGSGALKIAEITQKNGKPFLKSAGIVEVPESMLQGGAVADSEALAVTIRQAIAASGASAREAVVAVSSKMVFVRELTFPSMTQDELKEAIKWDVEKYVPYPPNSYYYDFSMIGKEKEGAEIKVLLVAASHDVVNYLSQAVEDAGLKLIAVDIEPLAIHRTMPEADNLLVVDMGTVFSQITIFQQGIPVLTREIEIGGQRFTEEIMQTLGLEFAEAERLKQRQEGLLQKTTSGEEISPFQQQVEMLILELTREVRRTAEYYQMQHQGSVFDRLVVTGGGAKLDNLIDHIKGQFEDMQVCVHDPLYFIEVNPSLDPGYMKSLSSQLSVAVGLALYGGGI